MLKAQCLWRLKRPLKLHQAQIGHQADPEMSFESFPVEAIQCFEMAKRFKSKYDQKETVQLSTKQLED